MNPLQFPIDDLFARLALINGLLHTFESQQRNFRSRVAASLERSKFDRANFVTGANLIIRDLTEWPAHGWAEYYPAGGFVAQGEEYLNLEVLSKDNRRGLLRKVTKPLRHFCLILRQTSW
jgi:hypothetical protein